MQYRSLLSGSSPYVHKYVDSIMLDCICIMYGFYMHMCILSCVIYMVSVRMHPHLVCMDLHYVCIVQCVCKHYVWTHLYYICVMYGLVMRNGIRFGKPWWTHGRG
ncbi:hypothetical protein KP509_16G024100 [Ceratopteris richardii]|uniref:Uncharacterized protein n=1 Tax=Ceratopteris richardii TaxID=49495 RepID=A0A8T2T0X1_CERRI|nr:hypothetical protein KP509_16G024100 [Ceratopteris richardii]